jgi:acyl-CoA thioesterase
MRTYYQVCAGFKFSGCKPLLVSLSLHSTPEYFSYLAGSVSSPLSHSQYFHTLPEANHYISYLFSRYPNSTAPRPVLDALQPLLFNGL